VKGWPEDQEGEMMAEWDPYSIPVLTEVSGRVKFGDILEGVTMQEQVDEFTGLSRKVIIESKDPDLRPRISIKDDKGKTMNLPGSASQARYLLPVGANIFISEGDDVEEAVISSSRSQERPRRRRISQEGLPRVQNFRSQKTKGVCLIK
jgi:DNA-directed RNA polymerase subunit beta'